MYWLLSDLEIFFLQKMSAFLLWHHVVPSLAPPSVSLTLSSIRSLVRCWLFSRCFACFITILFRNRRTWQIHTILAIFYLTPLEPAQIITQSWVVRMCQHVLPKVMHTSAAALVTHSLWRTHARCCLRLSYLCFLKTALFKPENKTRLCHFAFCVNEEPKVWALHSLSHIS